MPAKGPGYGSSGRMSGGAGRHAKPSGASRVKTGMSKVRKTKGTSNYGSVDKSGMFRGWGSASRAGAEGPKKSSGNRFVMPSTTKKKRSK